MTNNGLFRRAYDGMIPARERQARELTANYMLSLDDRTLRTLGYDRATLRQRIGVDRSF